MNDMNGRLKGLWTVASIALAVAVAALLVAFVRTPKGGSGDRKNTLQEVLRRQEIRAVAVPIPPMVNIDPQTKKVTGYAVDVIEAIAAKANLKVTYTVADWGNMGSELTSGKNDIVCSGIFMNLDRAKDFSFSDPFTYWGLIAVVRADQQKISGKADLQLPGLRVAALKGEQGFQWASKNMPKAIITPMSGSDLTQPMLEVLAGRADVAFADPGTAHRFISEHREAKILFENDPLDVNAAGFMLRQGDWELQQFLNVGLQQLQLSGELDAIESRYAAQKVWISMPKPLR